MRQSRIVPAVVALSSAVVGSGSVANAQVASAILREGDPISPGGATVTAINNTAVNAVGGYACTVNTSDGLSNIWGNLAGGVSAVIRSEGKFDGLAQTSYETFFGIGATKVTYSPLGSSGGFTSLDAVFRDDDRVAVERDAHPLIAGQFWSFGSRPSITTDGEVWFVGGITSTAGGATQNRGLFTGGDSDSVVLLGGDSVPGLSNPLNTGTAVDFDFRVAQSGNHFIAPVVLTGGTATDSAVVLDGAAAMAGGDILREGTLVPVAAGGNGVELYQAFDFMGVTDSGAWMVTGDTNATATTDEYVMLDGTMVLRDGDSVGADTVQGDIEGAYLNNDGDYAVVWDVSGGTLEALIVNGTMVLREGDRVDWDGDGVLDDNTALTDFTGISSFTLSNRAGGLVTAQFTADVNVGGTVLEGFFQLSVQVGDEPRPGDLNCDGEVNDADCEPMMLALNDPVAYRLKFPECDILAGDLNSDGEVNSLDIASFCRLSGARCAICCPCDWNGDSSVNSQDFFDFLAVFFESSADFNMDGVTNSQDFFDFLECFFTGC